MTDPDRHLLCNACFAVCVPQYPDRSVGPCHDCDSNLTAFVLQLPIHHKPIPETEPQHA